MSKIRRIDFSPAEWLVGTVKLTDDQKAIYWDVCALIYDSGGPVRNDPKWIGRMAFNRGTRKANRVITELISLGKLRLTEEGLLTNRRAEIELDRAADRIEAAKKLPSSWEVRPLTSKLNENKSLKKNETGLSHHQPSTINHHESVSKISTDAARGAAQPEGSAPRATIREEWERRLNQYDPHQIRKTWSPFWGPRPDQAGTQPAIPPDLLAAWRDSQRKRA